MGSIQETSRASVPEQNNLKEAHESLVELPIREDNVDASQSFEITDLATEQTESPTGMKNDILLLSWCIVLLRTSEGGEVPFEWCYKNALQAIKHRSLSTSQVVKSLEDTVGQVRSGISHQISISASTQDIAKSDRPASLLLSTSSLSQTPNEGKDEVVLHLEVYLKNGLLEIRPVWNNGNILPFTITRYIRTLVDTIQLCISNPDASIEECIRPTTHDLDEIWRWNHALPPSYNYCINETISERAKNSPEKVAIDSWDGSLTYDQVDRYSTFVAGSLQNMGVKLHDFLPVCFEKSKWTIVAVLAVMKVGATFVLMDPSLPLARLQNMAKQVDAKAIVSSRNQHDLTTSILPDGKFLVIEADTFVQVDNQLPIPQLLKVPSSTLMYIIFTSGSTGTPKGVTISHETYTSSAIPRAKAVGYTEESKVLDFASYAFDVSIDSMLLTLANGGCLCIPSDEDRMNDINGVIRRMRVNYAGITPSVARILEADVISSLSGLGLGGEAASARDVTIWGRDTRIIIGYGPCECTIGCTVNSSAATGRDYISIGTGNGAAIWIVDPNNHESLMPVGAVGELLVEGPIVGQGYLNDPEKTAASFIEDPQWLVAGHKNYRGRRGRLYKTGDLGKYDPDGSGGIVFAGRKDTQVKLRGQRVELGEIESQLKSRLPSDTNVIAEVIVPQGTGGQATLVAFIATQSTKSSNDTEISSVKLVDELRNNLSKADTELAKVLPRYMVPTAYIPVNHIPVLISGKTDRRKLRQFGATVDLRELDQDNDSKTSRELNDLEQRLRQAWSQVLKVNEDSIRLDDNFFVLGGDSLAAMRLVSICREHGLDITVANTFDHPTLKMMATVVRIHDSQTREEILPFSMVSQTVESICDEAHEIFGFDKASIQDVYPCTPTQESLFTFSLKSVKAYVAQRVARISPSISLDSWKRAWEEVVAESPILRTRLAQLQEPGLQQVVLDDSISWKQSNDLAKYLSDDRNDRMDLGQSLARYAIVDDENDGKRYMVWTVHHVLYDGWSEPIILKQVSNALHGQSPEFQTHMREFVKNVRDTDEVAMQEYWRKELKNAVGPQFPRLPSRDYLPIPDAMIEHQISMEAIKGTPFTMATLIRGAWALVSSQYTGNDDVVFGETLTGRDIALPGVESIVGPLIATVPVRIYVHRTSSVEAYLQTIQQAMMARTPYQHMGMQNIRKVSRDAQHACEAGTGLVIQPEPEYTGSELGFEQGDVVREALHFNPYPLMIACGIRKDGFRVCANFDSSLVEVAQMKRVLMQLEVTCMQLTRDISRRVGDISCLPKAELDQIWRWNQVPPCSFDESSRKLRANSSIKQGSFYPRAAVPWVCDPRNPSLLSPIGCIGELWFEGPLLSGETVETPPWLLAGTSVCDGRMGLVQATGDLVRLQEDGSLIFVGRKENIVPIQGHAVNITDIEAHITRHLPTAIRASAAVVSPAPSGTSQVLEQELVVFIEQHICEEDTIELMWMQHRISCDTSDASSSEMIICNNITVNLAVALKKLDKFAQDSLPSYMIPSAYIVVEKLPTVNEQLDRDLLAQLASNIPNHVLTQLQAGFKKVWTDSSTKSDLTASEKILQSAWATILKIPTEKIDTDDNFFRLGGDSVLAMKLVSYLRSQGHNLTVADIFQHMRLGDAAKVLSIDVISTNTETRPYEPYSTLTVPNVESFLSENIRPKLANANWSIRDVAPVTDSQALDIRGTIQAPRTSIQYTMLYFNSDIDQQQLIAACKKLVAAHDILRTVFIDHESRFYQVVLDELADTISMEKTDQGIDQHVSQMCTEDIETNFQLGSFFTKIMHVKGSDGQQALVVRLSHAQYDGVSLPRLLRDLETSYVGQNIQDVVPFPYYLSHIRDEHVQLKATNYWRSLLHGSSLSVISGKVGQPTDKSVFHSKPVDDVALPLKDITIANLLTGAWAVLLARRLKKTDVTFGSVTSGRNMDLANVENVMGPCYQLTPVRVTFEGQWTAMDLLRFVQKQSAESAAYDFLGFENISTRCTEWPLSSMEASKFFDSVVHHQDFEDFDSMPFAGGSCRVDIMNPHGDAADPMKIVTFVREGKLHVGVVGSENDVEIVDTILAELAKTVQELVEHREEPVSLDIQTS